MSATELYGPDYTEILMDWFPHEFEPVEEAPRGPRQWGIRGRPPEHQSRDEIRALHRQGLTRSVIAATVGAKYGAVRQALLPEGQLKKDADRNAEHTRQRKMWCIFTKGEVCVDGRACGNIAYDGENGAVFTFDHRDPETKHPKLCGHKKAPVAMLYSVGMSFEEMVAELDKVDLKCHNCHHLSRPARY